MRRYSGLLFLIGLVGLVACAQDRTAVPPTPPGIEVTPSPVDFGPIPVGNVKSVELKLTNRGSKDVQVTSATVEDTSAFSLGPVPSAIPANGSVPLWVTFAPQRQGSVSSKLVIATDSDDQKSIVVDLLGTGSGIAVVLHTPELDYGKVFVGEEKTLIIKFENKGDLEARLTLIDQGVLPTHFHSQVPLNTSTIIGQGETDEIPITFNPTMSVSYDFELRFRPCDSCDVVPVRLKARGLTSSFRTSPVSTLLFGEGATQPEPNIRELPLQLINDGDAPLTVLSIEAFEGGDWTTISRAGPFEIAGDALETVTVSVQVSDMARAGRLRIKTTDPRRPEVLLDTAVPAAEPRSCLIVSPSIVDFGTSRQTCPVLTRTVTIFNICRTPITLSSPRISDTSGAFVVVAPPTGRDVTPATPVKMDVRFLASQRGSFTANLELDTSESATPISIPVQGRIESLARQTDTFQQWSPPKGDVLFVIDNAGAMSPYQASLNSNLSDFMAYLQQQEFDYHVAVTTTDVSSTGAQGRFLPLDNSRPAVVGRQTPNAEQVFLANTKVGTNGSTTEKRALEAVKLALSPSLLAGANAGFLRPDASLSVIIISATPEASLSSVDDYVNELWALKGQANLVTVSVVSKLSTGDRYSEAVKKSGGINESIDVANWAQSFKRVSVVAFSRKTRFLLSRQPNDPAMFEVLINGELTPPTYGNGGTTWSYVPASNSIDFTPTAIPPDGSTIEVSYDLTCR